jgi:hypothetical protein
MTEFLRSCSGKSGSLDVAAMNWFLAVRIGRRVQACEPRRPGSDAHVVGSLPSAFRPEQSVFLTAYPAFRKTAANGGSVRLSE